MKAMIILSYILCGLGIAGGFIIMGEGDDTGGILAFFVYGFFLAFTIMTSNERKARKE